MRTVTLVSLGLGGAGVATGAGFAISSYIGGESIENHFKNLNDKKKTFLSSITGNDLQEVLKAYDSSKRFKPKDDNNQDLKKAGLVEWCNNAIKDKYRGNEDDKFKGVDSWCYINNNSFEQELVGTGKTKIAETSSTHKDWVDSWSKYAKDKTKLKLEITGHAESAKLNGTTATEGQQALMNWCKEKTASKMYLDNAKDDFNRFRNWCAK